MASSNFAYLKGKIVRCAIKNVGGQRLANFTVVYGRDKRSIFLDVEQWGVNEKLAKLLTRAAEEKGVYVIVKGELRQDTWQNSEGQNRSKIKLVADDVSFSYPTEKREDKSEQSERPRKSQNPRKSKPKPAPVEVEEDEELGGDLDDDDDDVPF